MRVIIFGAGLAGLTCAKALRDRDAEVAVFEASDGSVISGEQEVPG